MFCTVGYTNNEGSAFLIKAFLEGASIRGVFVNGVFTKTKYEIGVLKKSTRGKTVQYSSGIPSSAMVELSIVGYTISTVEDA